MKISGYKDTLNWYEKYAQKYATKTTHTSKNDTRQLNEFASYLPPHAKVLDAGCGAGRDSEWLRRKHYEVTGIDISRNLLEEAKKLYPLCIFQFGDMLDLPFPNESFDGVWAHASIVHFDEDDQIEKAVNEIRRVLKIEGIAHILVRAKKDKEKQIIKDSLAEHKRFYRNFSQEEIRDLLKKNNLEVVSLSQYDESKLAPEKRPGEGIQWIVVLAKKIIGSHKVA